MTDHALIYSFVMAAQQHELVVMNESFEKALGSWADLEALEKLFLVWVKRAKIQQPQR